MRWMLLNLWHQIMIAGLEVLFIVGLGQLNFSKIQPIAGQIRRGYHLSNLIIVVAITKALWINQWELNLQPRISINKTFLQDSIKPWVRLTTTTSTTLTSQLQLPVTTHSKRPNPQTTTTTIVVFQAECIRSLLVLSSRGTIGSLISISRIMEILALQIMSRVVEAWPTGEKQETVRLVIGNIKAIGTTHP